MLQLSFFVSVSHGFLELLVRQGVALDGRAGFRYCEVDVFVYVEQAEQSEDGFLLPGREYQGSPSPEGQAVHPSGVCRALLGYEILVFCPVFPYLLVSI